LSLGGADEETRQGVRDDAPNAALDASPVQVFERAGRYARAARYTLTRTREGRVIAARLALDQEAQPPPFDGFNGRAHGMKHPLGMDTPSTHFEAPSKSKGASPKMSFVPLSAFTARVLEHVRREMEKEARARRQAHAGQSRERTRLVCRLGAGLTHAELVTGARPEWVPAEDEHSRPPPAHRAPRDEQRADSN